MCGIFFSIARDGAAAEGYQLSDKLKSLLDGRGPDSQKSTSDSLTLPFGRIVLNWYSTVLSLRGTNTVSQPVVNSNSTSKLCWNGEAWSIGGNAVSGNDAKAIFDLLAQAVSQAGGDADQADSCVIQILMSICGPFAFVYYDAVHARVYFGRDALGRRSLLIKQGTTAVTISSVSDGTLGWSEIPADGIYACSLDRDSPLSVKSEETSFYLPKLLSSVLNTPTVHYAYEDYGKYSTFHRETPSGTLSAMDVHSSSVAKLDLLLRKALAVRTNSIPYYGRQVNGVDAHERYKTSELTSSVQQEALDGIAIDGESQTATVTNSKPRVAVLFSGGLDCTVLTRLLHSLLPPNEEIDLLNVAFHNPRSHGAVIGDDETVFEHCPDRITARASHAELVEVCPGRRWRLVRINVPYADTLEHRDQVTSLMYPHDTEMDLSIALALYFAARGTGVTSESVSSPSTAYTTPARVVFSGLGADELFGGYQRHCTAYTKEGFKGLLEELELDISRLGQRNLGRDDRVISHWSKEARYPFLDEELVDWAITAPVWDKCGFGQPLPLGELGRPEFPVIGADKKVLRLLAVKLGMDKVAREKKRAIQFGARTAKMESGRGKVKGTQKIW